MNNREKKQAFLCIKILSLSSEVFGKYYKNVPWLFFQKLYFLYKKVLIFFDTYNGHMTRGFSKTMLFLKYTFSFIIIKWVC